MGNMNMVVGNRVRKLVEAALLMAALLSPLLTKAADGFVDGEKSGLAVTSVPVVDSVPVANSASHPHFPDSHWTIRLFRAGLETVAEFTTTTRTTNSTTTTPSMADVVPTVTRLSLNSDLHRRVREGRLSAEEALTIETELASRQDVFYARPSDRELKSSIGFSPDALVTPEDELDLARVHLQLTLDVSPATAAYLIDSMSH